MIYVGRYRAEAVQGVSQRQTVQTRGRLQKDTITPCFCLLETFRLDVEVSEGQSVLLGESGLGFGQTNCL